MPPPPGMPMLLSPSASSTESDDADTDVDDPTLLLAAGTQSRLRRRPAVAVHARQLLPDTSAPGTALFCGAERCVADPAADDWWDARRPAVPQILPDDGAPPQPQFTRSPRTSTGCGELVHKSAHSARAGGRWMATVEGVQSNVVRLESGYFSEKDRAGLGLAEAGCGCIVEGVGCAMCGNALGALHTPCRVHQPRKGPAHYVFLPESVSPPIKNAAESSHPAPDRTPRPTDENIPPPRPRGEESPWERSATAWFDRTWQTMYPAVVQELPRPRTPPPPLPRTPPPARARTPPDAAEVARIDAQLVAIFSGRDGRTPTDAPTTQEQAVTVSSPPPPAPTAVEAPAVDSTTPEQGSEAVERMEVDEAAPAPSPQPVPDTVDTAQPAATTSTPPLSDAVPPPPTPHTLPPAVSENADTISDDGIERESHSATMAAVMEAMELEPLVFSTPPLMQMRLPEVATTPPPVVDAPVGHDAAVDERTRARIMALFAQRWERPSIDHSHLLGVSSPSASTSILPPVQSLSRSASTSASTSTNASTSTSTLPTRSLRRTSGRPDLHAAATSRAQLVGRRRTSTPGTPGGGAGAQQQQQPTVRFPSVREQEAWLEAETGRRPLRRASVPDLRRRAGAGEERERERDGAAAAAARVVRLGRPREPRAEGSLGMGTGTGASAGTGGRAVAMDVDGEDSDGETVRAVEEAPQGAASSTVLAGLGTGVVEPPHITRARERILTRERNRLEMLRLMREQRQNTIEYTDVSRPPQNGTGGTAVQSVMQPVVRARTWFER